jgi:hypothetical protein
MIATIWTSLYSQIVEIWSSPIPSALSIYGLIAQTIVFATLGATRRVRYEVAVEQKEWAKGNVKRTLLVWFAWYEMGGWTKVNNLLYAFLQATLFIVTCFRYCRSPSVLFGED